MVNVKNAIIMANGSNDTKARKFPYKSPVNDINQ